MSMRDETRVHSLLTCCRPVQRIYSDCKMLDSNCWTFQTSFWADNTYREHDHRSAGQVSGSKGLQGLQGSHLVSNCHTWSATGTNAIAGSSASDTASSTVGHTPAPHFPPRCVSRAQCRRSRTELDSLFVANTSSFRGRNIDDSSLRRDGAPCSRVGTDAHTQPNVGHRGDDRQEREGSRSTYIHRIFV
jgi:hypothetical protein